MDTEPQMPIPMPTNNQSPTYEQPAQSIWLVGIMRQMHEHESAIYVLRGWYSGIAGRLAAYHYQQQS